MRPNEYNDLLCKIKCSDEFRSRMQEKLKEAPAKEAEYEETVSGTEVITQKSRWGRFAAAAAVVVLIGGVAGGGAYHFANINEDTKIEETQAGDSILYELKEHKDDYDAKLIVMNHTNGNTSIVDINKDQFFSYMENNNVYYELPYVVESRNSISVVFSPVDTDKDLLYQFEISENDTFNWRKTENGKKSTAYYSYDDGIDHYGEFGQMFVGSEIMEEMRQVSKEYLEKNLKDLVDSVTGQATLTEGGEESRDIKYEVDSNGLLEDILSFDWKTSYAVYGKNMYMINLNKMNSYFMMSDMGYLVLLNDTFSGTYKLANSSDLAAFKSLVIAKHLSLAQYDWTIDSSTIKRAFSTQYEGITVDFYPDSGQFTESTKYVLRDSNGFKKAVSSLQWVSCETDEAEMYKDFYSMDSLISRNGYILPKTDGARQYAYKLKNESSIERLREICDEHLIPLESGVDASKYDIMDAFPESYKGGAAQFRADDGQFTESRECTVTDFDSLKKEISDLEWTFCLDEMDNVYNDFYIAGAVISRNGYVYPQNGSQSNISYKLKNDSDIEKLRGILDKYIEIQDN